MSKRNRFAWEPGDLVPVLPKQPQVANHLPTLMETLRPTLAVVGEWAGVGRSAAMAWQKGTAQPQPEARAKLVAAVRSHAAALLTLADAVKQEQARRPTK